MMKKILALFSRDIKSGLRDNLLLYLIIAPLLLALGLKFFIPSANTASLQYVVQKDMDKSIIDNFSKYSNVIIVEDYDSLKERVLEIDDAAGIIWDKNNKLSLVQEGNEDHATIEMAKKIINEVNGNFKADISYSLSSIGVLMSPIERIGVSSILITCIVLGGMMIGLNIVEEKESRTLSSINVSAIDKVFYIIGKSLMGTIVPFLQVFAILFIMNLLHVNLFMIFIVTLVSLSIGIIFGFLMGALSSNQITAIANMKGLFILVSVSILGAILLPYDKQFFMYAFPTYWSFVAYSDIITNNASMGSVLYQSVIILVLSAIIGLLLKKRIEKGIM